MSRILRLPKSTISGVIGTELAFGENFQVHWRPAFGESVMCAGARCNLPKNVGVVMVTGRINFNMVLLDAVVQLCSTIAVFIVFSIL